MRIRRTAAMVATALVLLLSTSVPAVAGPPERAASSPERAGDKSFAVYIGKNRTEDGHTFLGGFGHEPSSHWVDIVEHQQHPAGATMTVGATEEALIPGELTEIPQARETARYITSNYSEFAGFPAPLTNGGLNEYGVAARDVWSPSREELVDATPTPQHGPQYSDLSRIAMERAHSAKEAVTILGRLINRYGFTTYGGNSHLFADKNEGWVFLDFAGGQGLWAAQRLGPDDVRVSYPGYIADFPTDWRSDPNFMASKNFVSYAEKRGWWRPDSGDSFNVQDVYGAPFPGRPVGIGEQAEPEDPSPYRHPPSLEAEFEKMGTIKLQDVMRMVRDPRWSDDRSGYGHVAELDGSVPNAGLSKLWVATTAAVTAPYVPVYIGTRAMPPEYRQHRYLTHNGASEFIDPEFAQQEATEYATQTFKRLLYATCSQRDGDALSEVTTAFEGFEAGILDEIDGIESRAREQYSAGEAKQARGTLTEASNDWAMEGLGLGDYLLQQQLATLRQSGIHAPDVPTPKGETAEGQNQGMSLRSAETARDRMNCDQGGGWAEGGTLDRQGSYGDPSQVPDYSAAAEPTDPTGAAAEPTGARDRGWTYALTAVAGLLLGGAAVGLVRRFRQ